jgi:hypothetical protein
VAERHEGGDHARDTAGVVDADLGLTERVRRQVDDRGTVFADALDVSTELLIDDRIVETAAGEDDRRRADRAQQPDVRVLALWDPVGAARDDEIATLRSGVLDARTTSAKYGSVMSWTMTPTTGTWLLRSPRARALGT